MPYEPPVRLDARIELLRRLETHLAEKDDPDLTLLALVRNLIMEAEAEAELER